MIWTFTLVQTFEDSEMDLLSVLDAGFDLFSQG